MVAFAPTEGGTAAPHNGGDASGWGTGNQTGNGFNPQGQSIEESESGPLFSQMAALDVSTVDIRLNINNVEQPLIVADETTPKSVLPKIKPGTMVHGSAVIHLQDGTARTAYLDETEAALHGVLKFKVPYYYTAKDLTGTQVASGTYYARDGINLAAQTIEYIAGWQCVEDGSVHNGSYVTGVRGDITLNAVASDDAPILRATSSTDVLFARATSADTATITITNVTGTPQIASISSLLDSGTFVRDSTDETKYTLTINIKTSTTPQSAAVMPVWFTDSAPANITITDDSGIQASVPLTLKNKYSYQLQIVGSEWTDNTDPTAMPVSDYTSPPVEIEQGESLTFADAAAALTGYYPSDRQIVSFYYEPTTAYYNKSPTPATITFSSASFVSRNVLLKAVPNMRINRNRTIGGYAGTTPQDGSFNNPYLLNYYGTATERKIQIEIYDYACYPGNLTLVPDPSQHINIDTIMSTMFTRTQDDNKFTYELKSGLTESSVYIDPIKLIATDPTTGATKDVWINVVKVKIGNKDTPDTVGDIVFNDGSAMSYTDFAALDAAVQNEKKAAAIALIFYKGSASDALGARTLGVGLKHETGQKWCTNSAAAYSKNITTIQCPESGSAGTYTFSGDNDGSDNLSQIATFLANNGSTNDTGTAANYPAFYFAKKYNEQKLGSESSSRIPAGSEFENGWYLPSIAELFQIYACREDSINGFDIDAASQALGGDSFGNSYYWSSSQYATNGVNAYLVFFANGYCVNDSKNYLDEVCAVRAF